MIRAMAIFVAFLAVWVGAHVSKADSCLAESAGIDTTAGDTNIGLHNAQAVAQVFLAPDSLIASITVWRPVSQFSNVNGMHLYITKLDSLTGKPSIFEILLDGPTVIFPDTGTVAKPVTYEFDPPFALPSKGRFAFAIKEENPYCFGGFTLRANDTNAYPDGDAWTLNPNAACDDIGNNPFHSQDDLIFTVTFCSPAVPTLPATWGGVKASYR
jgi:hypothetical protein